MLILGITISPPSLSLLSAPFWTFRLIVCLSICGGLVPGPLRTPKSVDAQAPYIKWPNTMAPPYLQGCICWFNQLQIEFQTPQIRRADATCPFLIVFSFLFRDSLACAYLVRTWIPALTCYLRISKLFNSVSMCVKQVASHSLAEWLRALSNTANGPPGPQQMLQTSQLPFLLAHHKALMAGPESPTSDLSSVWHMTQNACFVILWLPIQVISIVSLERNFDAYLH